MPSFRAAATLQVQPSNHRPSAEQVTHAELPINRSVDPSSSAPLKLRQTQHQPLHALAAEVDLNSLVVPLALISHHYTATKLGMIHTRADVVGSLGGFVAVTHVERFILPPHFGIECIPALAGNVRVSALTISTPPLAIRPENVSAGDIEFARATCAAARGLKTAVLVRG